MKRLAVTIAVMTFFASAGLGLAGGATPFSCSMKAVAAAVVIYIVARIAGGIAARIIADAMVQSAQNDAKTKDI